MLPIAGLLSTYNTLMVNGWLHNIHKWLMSSYCVLCGQDGINQWNLCKDCYADLPRISSACSRCAAPIRAPNNGLCGSCIANPPRFDRSRALFHYSEPVSSLIHGMKYNGKLNHAKLLGELMAEAWIGHLQNAPDLIVPDLIVPVPLHSSRLRERGYNQALELARPIARRLKIPIDVINCRRIRRTETQALLPAKDRRANLAGAFTWSAKSVPQRVAIVDDVMTTTHTANALARELRKTGVANIEVWVCARAMV